MQGVVAQFDIIDQSDSSSRYWKLEFFKDSVFFFGDVNSSGAIVSRDITLGAETIYDFSLPISVHETSKLNDSTLFCFGLSSGFIEYDHSNSSFIESNIGIPIGGNKHDLLFINQDTGFVSYQDGGAALYKTEDGGNSWIEQFDTSYTISTAGNLGGRELLYTNDTLFGLLGSGIMYSPNLGNTWYMNTISNINGTYFSMDKRDEFFVCVGQGFDAGMGINFGAIAVSLDFGTSWSTFNFNDIYAFSDVDIVNDSVIYAVGRGQGQIESIYKSIDKGQSWQLQTFNVLATSSIDIKSIKCLDQDNCIACGDFGLILRSSNWNWVSVKEEAKVESNINIYPNPSSSIFNIESEQTIESYQVLDQLGKVVLTKEENENHIQVDLTGYSRGVYFVRIITEGYEVTKKLVKE
jgi:hypothetical protein